MSSVTEIACVPRGNKGCGNLLKVYFLRKKLNSTKRMHQLSIRDVKMLLLTGKTVKAYKVRNFLFTLSTKFPPFFQTWILARSQ